METCCGKETKPARRAPPEYPDHSGQLGRLNRIAGQLGGVKRMIEERRYCPEILTQLRAAGAALKSVERLVLSTHLRHCVSEAVNARDFEQAENRIEELVALLEKQA